MHYISLLFICILIMVPGQEIHPAPLDEFLITRIDATPWHGEYEVGLDVMNKSVDLFGVRGDYLDPRSDSIGDYGGAHVDVKLALTKRIGVDAGIWKRSVKTPYDKGESYFYKGAVQYQATYNMGYLPALSLRLSAWGNSADEVNKGSQTSFGGYTADAVRVTDPSDKQAQIDLIGTWISGPNWLFSSFIGAGKTTTHFNELYATSGSCEYKVDSSSKSQMNINLAKISPGCNLQSFSASLVDPQNNYPGPDMGISYDGTYFQLGGMAQIQDNKWRGRLGYRFQKMDREIDDIVRQKGNSVYDANHTLTGDVTYKIWNAVGAFVRGSVMSNQFAGDIPFAYTAYTSHKFSKKYGFLTFGLTGGF